MRQETNPSRSSPAIGARKRTLVSVEHDTRSTYTVVLLTFSPAALRRIRRSLLALLAWVIAAMAGSSISTFVQALR